MRRSWCFAAAIAAVLLVAAPIASGQTLTDDEYKRLDLGNHFANVKAKPIILKADRMTPATLGVPTSTVLASTANGEGLSLIGIEDAGTYFGGATDAEAALQLIGPTMTDDRDPNAHALTHATGGGDDITPLAIGAATAADLDALEVRAVHVLAPVIADWDPTDIGAGVVDPPTSVAGDRYIASATEAPYTTPRIYEYDGAAWVETAGDNGDVIFHEDDNVTKIFDGAGWRNVYDSANLLAFTGDSGAGGAIGLVPAPAAGDAAAGKYLDADGTWTVPPDTDTTYNDFTGDSGAGGVAGLVPAPAAGDAAAGKYLDADGTWTVPPTSSAADAVLGDQARRSTTTAQTTTTATPLKVTFETSEVAGDVTYLTGDFTVPATGVYLVVYSLTFAGAAGGTERVGSLYVDGFEFGSEDVVPDGTNAVSVYDNGSLYLTAGQVLALYGKQDSGGDLDVTAGRIAVQRVQ